MISMCQTINVVVIVNGLNSDLANTDFHFFILLITDWNFTFENASKLHYSYKYGL